MPFERDVGGITRRCDALAEKEGAFGAESMEVGVALYELGSAYMDSGDYAVGDVLERALRIYEREYPSDNTAEVAQVLDDLGNAYYSLGDYAKARDVMERALAVKERGVRPRPPGSGQDADKPRERVSPLATTPRRECLQARALAIKERAYGPDHPEVAKTQGTSGTHTLEWRKGAGDIMERALAIITAATTRRGRHAARHGNACALATTPSSATFWSARSRSTRRRTAATARSVADTLGNLIIVRTVN